MNKYTWLAVGLVVGLVLGFGLRAPIQSLSTGGVVVHNVTETFDAGIEVNGTTAISSARAAFFTAITNTGAFTQSALATLSAGLTVSDGETNVENFVQGDSDGAALSITGATSTLTAAQVCDNSLITFAPAASPATTTLPVATSTVADCLTQDGDWREFAIRNASSGTLLAISTSTGDLLHVPTNASSTSGKDAIIDGGNYAWIKMLRVNSTTVQFLVDENVTK